MRSTRDVLLILVLSHASAVPAAEEPWFQSPSLGVMTGFIYEPLKPYTIQEWQKGLGDKMDAHRWVADFKAAGATYLVFYDKWIDGLVFHDTKTTAFKTKRDFVSEIADACHQNDMRLVYYFNAISDGNPEFDQWAARDRQDNPIVFSPRWPTRCQTLHSPFRKISVAQIHELLTGYGQVDGFWLDIFREPPNAVNPCVLRAYEKMYGTPFDKASGTNLTEFHAQTLASYLDEVRAMAAEQQPGCLWTSNGSASNTLNSVVWSERVGSRLDFGSNEGHSFQRMDQLARMAWVLSKPMEIGLLLCSSWFTPLEDEPPPASMTPKQAIAAAAVAVCQGASVYMALAPGHSGTFGEDLQRAKSVGDWFRKTEPWLKNARPYADVAIVLGTPSVGGPSLAGRNTLWEWYDAAQRSTLDEAFAMGQVLERRGVFSHLLYAFAEDNNWPDLLSEYRAILLPERAALDDAHAGRLRQYVKQGGRLIAFGHASMLNDAGIRQDDYALADLFGAHYQGEVAFAPKMHKTRVQTDTEYSSDFAAQNLVDGKPTAWASQGTPMPHWAQITLPEPVDVAAVEVVSRQGPYLVTDIDIEVFNEQTWDVVKSIRDAATRIISAKLEKRVRTRQIRVKVFRELYSNEDRQYADLEAIRVFDVDGRDCSTNRVISVPVIAASPDLERAFEGVSLSFAPMAVAVKPAAAEVLARLDNENHSPAILRHRFGQGETLLITTSEGAFRQGHAFWDGLMQLANLGPTISYGDQASERYRFVLTRVGEAHVLHVIDRLGGIPGHEAADVTVTLDRNRLGQPRRVTRASDPAILEPEDRAEDSGGLMTLTIHPDPVASIVLQ